MHKKKFYISLIATVIIIGTASYLISFPAHAPVECTMEAKFCPDGSAVGRVGPKCEFAPCPILTNDSATTTTGLSIGETFYAESLSITPLEVVQDSRCPIDVQCIWAGTVIVKTRISDEIESVEKDVELGKAQKFGDIAVTLTSVSPESKQNFVIKPEEYSFIFDVTPLSVEKGTGILQGSVSIGPICPVERVPPDPNCEPTAEMYAARKIYVYSVDNKIMPKQQTAIITPDSVGKFSISLPAGSYRLEIPSQRIGGISGLSDTVNIEDGKTVMLQIDIDTGIR